MEISSQTFEQLVAKALDRLPKTFQERLSNVSVIIENIPSAKQLEENGVENGEVLFGLYEGVPQTQRDSSYQFVLPDKITIFREPLLAHCETQEELLEEISHTVYHEIGHHFGISDERFEEINRY